MRPRNTRSFLFFFRDNYDDFIFSCTSLTTSLTNFSRLQRQSESVAISVGTFTSFLNT